MDKPTGKAREPSQIMVKQLLTELMPQKVDRTREWCTPSYYYSFL